jgi:hypothetical protein
MDSILVVCYSATGTSLQAARLLCSHHGWPLALVTERRARTGLGGLMRCVLDSLLRRHPPICYDGPDPGDFRTVVLVSPIWVYRLAGPMRTFIAQHREALRRVAVISTMGSAGAVNAVAEVERLTGHPPIRAVAFTSQGLADGTATGRLIAFGHLLRPGSVDDAAHAEAVLEFS